jgi:hypothetical protein
VTTIVLVLNNWHKFQGTATIDGLLVLSIGTVDGVDKWGRSKPVEVVTPCVMKTLKKVINK